jgi:hypothetical protein
MSALKFKKLTVIIVSSFCFWNVAIDSGNAAIFTFKNETDQILTDSHVNFLFGYWVNSQLIAKTLDANSQSHPSSIRPKFPVGIGQSFVLRLPLNTTFISAE